MRKLSVCTKCGDPLERTRIHEHYQEDIILPILDDSSTTTVTKQLVGVGYCSQCKLVSTGGNIELRGQQVTLGPNVRLLISYLTTTLDMTYPQIVSFLADVHQFVISEGEIAGVLQKQGLRLLPQYEQIKRTIREGPGIHLDETGFTIFSRSMGWAWCMGSTENEDVIYHLAESRGKREVTELLGTSQAMHVHDCYGAYRQLDDMAPGQTCWSHYFRVTRDLARLEAKTLGGALVADHCTTVHEELKAIYADLRGHLKEPFDRAKRQEQHTSLLARIDWFCVPDPLDPKKLQDLKARLQIWRHTLLTCLTAPHIPADNNKAERHLRKLVLKRKKSYGVRTLTGAKTLSILLSVFWTYKNRYRQQSGRLLPAIAGLGGG